MDRHIDYYFSLASPWSYMGHDGFMTIAREHGVSVRFKPFNTASVFSETGGLVLGERHPARQRYRLFEMQRWREKRNLPLNLQPAYFPADPTLAEKCVAAIQDAGENPSPFMGRAYRGVWAYDKNIADEHVVEGWLQDSGHDAHAVINRAGEDDLSAIREQNAAEAVAAGVVGAPGYVLDGEPFWGQDRHELLDDALRSGRAPYRVD